MRSPVRVSLASILLSCVSLLPASGAAPPEEATSGLLPVYVGTYTGGKSEGIYLLRFDPRTGALGEPILAAKTPSPSFLAFHPRGRFLYSVGETGTFRGEASGSVQAFSIDPESGRLELLATESSGGTSPCHLVVDPTGRNLLVANYGSGTVSVRRLGEDGKLGEMSAKVQHRGQGPNSRRQEGPHAHGIAFDPETRRAYVADLGTDEVVIYRFDAEGGTLERQGELRLPPGSGPRHVAFSPDGQSLYAIDELLSTIAVFRRRQASETFALLETVSTLPEGWKGQSTTAEIQVSTSGRFVYGSNRGHDSIAVFRVALETGGLRPVEHEPTGGKTPRNFRLDPTGKFLLAANQDSDSIVVFRIDPETGALAPTGYEARVPTPVCVEFPPASAPAPAPASAPVSAPASTPR